MNFKDLVYKGKNRSIEIPKIFLISKELINKLKLKVEEDKWDYKLSAEDGNFYSLNYLMTKFLKKVGK